MVLPLHNLDQVAYTARSYLIMCGRGGIGRRAALRSLWGNTRGSSSLLDRTISLFWLQNPANTLKGKAVSIVR
jgi:hypothetical protein